MADVFISYAREDRARAEQVARGLQSEGLDVFWDNEIPPGTTWADYIEDKLTKCKALIVLWSANSTKSQWVREEARMGRDKGVLIPAMIDASQAPFGFGEVQAANLAAWNGQGDHPEWRRFADAVRRAAGAPARPQSPPQPQPAYQAPRQQAASAPSSTSKAGFNPLLVFGGLGALAVVLVIGAMMSGGGGSKPGEQAMPTDTAIAPQAPQQTMQQPGQQQVTPDQQAQSIILNQLQHAQSNFAQEGFQQVGGVATGGLQQGQTWNVPVTLTAGYEYRVLGVCDQDCRDLDLSLYDGNGQMISQDTSADDHPVVSVQVTGSGQFTVQALMYNCSVAPCYYAIALYVRQPSGAQ